MRKILILIAVTLAACGVDPQPQPQTAETEQHTDGQWCNAPFYVYCTPPGSGWGSRISDCGDCEGPAYCPEFSQTELDYCRDKRHRGFSGCEDPSGPLCDALGNPCSLHRCISGMQP